MSIPSAITLGAILIATIYAVLIYNGLVQLKHNVAKAWSNIDVLLKQRHDELPKLIEVCRQYARFEQSTLTRVIDARAQVASARERHDLPALGEAEDSLRAGLSHLFALAEAYPELRTNEHFMQLQTRIAALENAIADRREWYNESANLQNIRIEQFPDLVVARLFRFGSQPLLEFAMNEKRDVDIKALFGA